MSKATAQVKERKSLSNNILDELVKRFEGMSFFTPSLELTHHVINRLHYLSYQDGSSPSVNHQSLEIQRRVIAEQFYMYLANISKKERALSNESIKLKEIVDYNFDKAIGLSYEDDDRKILDDFTSEFIVWLRSEGGRSETGWGSVELVSEDSIKLTRNPEEEEVLDLSDTPKKRHHLFRSQRS